jgi:hypothetical protein
MISEPVAHNLAPSFENTVKLWLDQTATKTKQWADAALGVDTVSLLLGVRADGSLSLSPRMDLHPPSLIYSIHSDQLVIS